MNINIDIRAKDGRLLVVLTREDGVGVFHYEAPADQSAWLAMDILAADGRQPKPATIEKDQEWRWLPDKDTRLVVHHVVDSRVVFFVAYRRDATSRAGWSKALLGDARWQFYGYFDAAPENL